MPAAEYGIYGRVHTAAEPLSLAERDIVIESRRKVMPDIPRRAGVLRPEIRRVRKTRISCAAKRRTAVGEGMAPNVGGQEVQPVRVALLQFQRCGGVIAIPEGRGHRESVTDTRASGRSHHQARAFADTSLCGPFVRTRVGIPEDELMRLVVALITHFERHVGWQLALHNHVPLLNHRVAEVVLNPAERDRSRQREHVRRIAPGKSAREVITAGTVRVRNPEELANAGPTYQVHGFVKRHPFPTVVAATLVFFAAVEDAVSDADARLFHRLVANSEPWPVLNFFH